MSEHSPHHDGHITSRIVREIQQGDASRFTELYSRIAPAVAAWVSVRVTAGGGSGLGIEAEDLMQEVWRAALEDLNRFEREKGSFRAWIFGISRNVLLGQVRRRYRRPDARAKDVPSDVPDAVTSISRRAARDEVVTRLVEIVRRLDDADRAIVGCQLEGLPHRETAELLGITEAAARKRWSRLSTQLRHHVGTDLSELFESDGAAETSA